MSECVFIPRLSTYFWNSFQKGGASHRLFGYIERIMANEKNLMPPFSPSIAREMQKRSAEKRKQNTAEKKLIRDRILERMNAEDWDEYIDGIISRAKESKADAEFLRDTIGEKPVEKSAQVNVDAEYVASVEYVKQLFGEDE